MQAPFQVASQQQARSFATKKIVSDQLRRAVDYKIFEISALLIEKNVDPVVFRESIQWFQPRHGEEVIEERYCEGLCAYPLCNRSISKRSSHGKYRIDSKNQKIYEVEFSHYYCSDKCLEIAQKWIFQLDNSLPYGRSCAAQLDKEKYSNKSSISDILDIIGSTGNMAGSLKEDQSDSATIDENGNLPPLYSNPLISITGQVKEKSQVSPSNFTIPEPLSSNPSTSQKREIIPSRKTLNDISPSKTDSSNLLITDSKITDTQKVNEILNSMKELQSKYKTQSQTNDQSYNERFRPPLPPLAEEMTDEAKLLSQTSKATPTNISTKSLVTPPHSEEEVIQEFEQMKVADKVLTNQTNYVKVNEKKTVVWAEPTIPNDSKHIIPSNSTPSGPTRSEVTSISNASRIVGLTIQEKSNAAPLSAAALLTKREPTKAAHELDNEDNYENDDNNEEFYNQMGEEIYNQQKNFTNSKYFQAIEGYIPQY